MLSTELRIARAHTLTHIQRWHIIAHSSRRCNDQNATQSSGYIVSTSHVSPNMPTIDVLVLATNKSHKNTCHMYTFIAEWCVHVDDASILVRKRSLTVVNVQAPSDCSTHTHGSYAVDVTTILDMHKISKLTYYVMTPSTDKRTTIKSCASVIRLSRRYATSTRVCNVEHIVTVAISTPFEDWGDILIIILR